MKKIITLFFAFFVAIFSAVAQDITVFNFEDVSPTFTGYDQLTTVANPAVGGVNISANVGQLTHVAQYNDRSTVVSIDPRFYTSYTIKAYSPTSTTGKVTVACFDATGAQLDWYEFPAITTAGTWVSLTRNLSLMTNITKVMVGWNRNNAISATATDNTVLIDDLIFKKSNFGTLFLENFKMTGVTFPWIGAPSTKTWSGGSSITTELDSVIRIVNYVTNEAYLKIRPVTNATYDPAVYINNINVTGYDSLTFSADFQWPYLDAENAIYSSAVIPESAKGAMLDVKVDNGAWVRQLTTKMALNAFVNQTLVLKNALGNPINNVSTISLRFSRTHDLSYCVDNVKISAKARNAQTALSNLATKSIAIYPNPASDYIMAEGAQLVQLYNLNGKLVLTANNSARIDISALSKGIYVVKVSIGNQTTISKLAKI